MAHIVFTFFNASLLLVGATAFAADDTRVQVGRYTELAGVSQEVNDPLAVVAQLRFPRAAVSNVGSALRHLLMRTGYSVQAGDEAASRLFQLPLPESQRALGPYPVLTMSRILVGEGYGVCVDRLSRTVLVRAGGSCASALAAGEKDNEADKTNPVATPETEKTP